MVTFCLVALWRHASVNYKKLIVIMLNTIAIQYRYTIGIQNSKQ